MGPWTLFWLCWTFVMAVVFPLYAGKKLRNYSALRLIIKGIGTCVALALACYGMLYHPDIPAMLIVAGLAVCTIADVLLPIATAKGIGMFFIGHCFYLLCYLRMAPFRLGSLLIFVVLYPIVIVLFSPALPQKLYRAAPYFFYCTVLLFSLSIALLLPGRVGLRGFCAALGALLFGASDLILANGVVTRTSEQKQHLVMGLYYSAQLILSLVALQPWLSS